MKQNLFLYCVDHYYYFFCDKDVKIGKSLGKKKLEIFKVRFRVEGLCGAGS